MDKYNQGKGNPNQGRNINQDSRKDQGQGRDYNQKRDQNQGVNQQRDQSQGGYNSNKKTDQQRNK